MNQTKVINAVLIQSLKQLGFQVHMGGDNDDASLRGRWWWTITRGGWSGIEASRGDFVTADEAWADADDYSREDEDLQKLRLLPVPTKWRLGTENSAIEVECDQTSMFGVATITSLGSENLYVEKNGVHYFSKIGCTERFAEGRWDFSKHPNGSDDPMALSRQLNGFVIYSAGEAQCADGSGYWSNEYGWVCLDQATVFSECETSDYSLPISTGQDACWMSFAEAERGDSTGQKAVAI